MKHHGGVGGTVSQRGLMLAVGLFLLAVVSTLLGIRLTDAQSTAQVVPVDGQVRISYTGLVFNRSTNTFDTVATLTNTGTTSVLAPISLVITSITPASVQLANSTGITSGGLPYLNVLASGSLNPGATLTPVVLKFKNPNRVTFTFKQSILGVLGSANHPPVADAGPDQTVTAGATVELDGTQSIDVDGNPLTYRWSFVSIPGGSQAVLANATTVNPRFVADKPGTYTVQLIANDGQVDSTPATVVISTQNSPPVANAGPNQLVASGTTAQLDGSHSTDVDGDALTYVWSFAAVPGGSLAQLAGPTTVSPSFLADKPGVYTVQLIVNDGRVDSAPASVIISTQSAPPVANAGPDQTVGVGTTVQLDGSKSAAANGGPLTYRWALITLAPGSTTTLVNPTKVNPSFVVDKDGIYVVQLTVNDGLVDSAPTTVVISTGNSRPLADAGPNQTAQVGQTVTLDGTGSHDADNDALSFDWSLLSKPANSSAILDGANQSKASFVPDLPGIFVAQLIVSDGQLDSHPVTTTVTITVAPPNHDPQITSTPITTGQQGVAYSYQVLANDPDGDPLNYAITVSPQDMTIGSNGLINWTPSGSGTFAVGIKVSDGRGGSATQSYNIVVSATQVTVPDVVGLTQAAATTAITSANLALEAVTQQTSPTVPAGNVISQDPAAGSLVAQGSTVNLIVSLGSVVLPPDPATVAPPLDMTVATNMASATSFLYTGADPIQTGVAAGTIDAKRAAVLRGKVMDGSGAALTGVKMSIVAHPEFGQTFSRFDGMFDMAVNGGGRLTVRYEKQGYLPAQRQVPVAWQEYTVVPDVVLLARDTQVTTIRFAPGASSMQVARGSVQTDADGTRRATVLFPAGTTAGIVQPDGSTQAASTLNVRLTEYTVGANGQQAMPAELPPTSAYTYAVELGADETVAKVNGRDVVFNQPVILYVENFLNIPVGEIVPVGYYDPTRSAWVGAPNGHVIKVLGSTSGLADLDVDGDEMADTGAALSALGITDAERQQLASLYPVGATLWRSAVNHFSTFDTNWSPVCTPSTCRPPDETPPPPPPACQTSRGGSIIGCERQTLGEQVELTGTQFTLHYQSDRVPGRTAEQGQLLTLATGGVPTGVQRTEVEILVAGQKLTQHLPVDSGITTLAWDGNDAYGRPLQGSHPVTVRIGYTYKIVVSRAIAVPSAWARFSGIPLSANPARAELTLWQERTTRITRQDQRGFGLGGWSLSELHAYDPAGRVLSLGDGTRREVDLLSAGVATTVAGDGGFVFNGDGIPATKSSLPSPQGIAMGPDGSIYVADDQDHRVRRIGPDGIIHTVAGTSIRGFSGDGGPATQAQLALPGSVAVAPDGGIYIADRSNRRVRRVDPNGIITTVAGTGALGRPTEGSPATQVALSPRYLAVGPDGALYVSDATRIWVIDQNGIIQRYAGGGAANPGDEGPALEAALDSPEGMSFASDGSLFFVDFDHIRKVTPQGIISTIAGNGSEAVDGDGGPATSAALGLPFDVAVGRDGSLYIAVFSNRVRRVGPDGVITTFAGNGDPSFNPDGNVATQTHFAAPAGVVVGPDNAVYISDRNRRIRRIAAAFPGGSPTDILVPSSDGGQVYVFSGEGRHLRTLDALTGSLRFQFSYDTMGYPTSVTDGDGNVTTIERNGATPTAIVAPGGQRTMLTTDGNGWLTRVSNPANESRTMDYTVSGLLERLVDPRGNLYRFTYDATGRLVRDEDPAGGSSTLARTEQPNGYTVTTTTALGRTRIYQQEQLASGALRTTVTGSNGTATVTTVGTDGSERTTYPDGIVATVQSNPDPRWGMLAPISTSVVTTPGGRTRTVAMSSSAVVADPSNPLSLQSLTRTLVDNGRASISTFQSSTRTLTNTSPNGRTNGVTLDARGRVAQRRAGQLDSVTYDYDSEGRLGTITIGAGVGSRISRFGYHPTNYLASITDPLDRVTNFTYDAAGRPISQTRPDGSAIELAYDANGNVSTVAPPGRPVHAFTFGATDLELQYNPPDVAGLSADETSVTYNSDRQPTLVARPDGRTINMTYDSAGRIARYGFSRGNIDVTYVASTGLLMALTAPGGIGHGFLYDGDLLISHALTGSISGNVAWTYDNDFRVASQSVNGLSTVNFNYDVDSLLTQAGALTIARDSTNGLIASTRLNAVTDAVSYNAKAEPLDYRAKVGATDIYRAQFTRDALGRITEEVETIEGATNTHDYTYDAAGRLIRVVTNGVTDSVYTYDANSNRTSYIGPWGDVTSTQVTVDAQDRTISYGTNVYTYSAYGDLGTKITGAGRTSYTYDEFGNLIQVTLPNGAVVDYIIDGLNRRIGKKVNGTLVKRWLWDDKLRILAELDGVGAITSRFVYATHVNVPDYVMQGPITYRLITDHLGSPRLLIDSATGVVVGRMKHDEYGRVTQDTISTLIPFGFAGGHYDSDTQLIRFGARDYDSETGRWTEKDPIRMHGGDSNFYSYVFGDPINFVDPGGLKAATIICQGGEYQVVENWAQNDPVLLPCVKQHEGVHIKHWKERYGADSCKGMENGTLPVHGIFVNDYDQFRNWSEIQAHEDSVKCLEDQKKLCKQGDAKTKKKLDERIAFEKDQILQYKNELHGGKLPGGGFGGWDSRM